MRVFILCTGRGGSTTIIKACQNITNYTAGHESISHKLGADRFNYADNHIEADNRLCWFLGQMDTLFGDEAFYVHLKRNRDKVAESFSKRYYRFNSIMDAFCKGVKGCHPEIMDDDSRLMASYDYVDSVNANIDLFLKDKSKKMTIEVENWHEKFPNLWKQIGAEGDFETAMQQLNILHNSKPKRNKLMLKKRLKLYLAREWRHINEVRNRPKM